MATPARHRNTADLAPALAAPSVAAAGEPDADEIIGVMDADTLRLSDGRCIALNPLALGDGRLYTFLLARRACQLGIAQLWIHPSWPGVLDDEVPGHLTAQYGAWVIGAKQPHWRVCFQVGTYTSAGTIIVSPALDARAPWARARTAEELLAALCAFRAATGLSYRRSPGLTGVDLIRDVHGYDRTGARKRGVRGRPLRLDVPGTLPDPVTNNAELPRIWMRDLTRDERRAKYLHSYDKNGAWLAACSSLALGFGQPEHTYPGDGRYDALAHPRDAKTGAQLPYPPGFWRAHIATRTLPIRPELPPLISTGAQAAETQVWITTPTLQLLYDLGIETCVTEAYIWPTHHRALEPWYKRLRDGRTQLMTQCTHNAPGAEVALKTLKLSYAAATGYIASRGWDRAGDTLYRPDWRTLLIAQSNAVIYRQMLAAADEGAHAFALGTDALYFTSDEPDPVKACPAALRLGDGLGAWKVKDSLPLAEILPVLDGAHGQYGALQLVQRALNARREGSSRVSDHGD
ncbi:MAG TPA: hypothetical protein VKQ30_23280 [Ktedonobacterales bacterium]|nr:hypothetical protein [Ktedonobacterales bacterium]